MAYMIHNTVTGETQVVETLPDPLGPEEVNRGETPSGVPPHLLVWDGAAIVTNMVLLKQQAHARTMALRDLWQEGGPEHTLEIAPYGVFQIDAKSREKIHGGASSATAAMVIGQGASFSENWTLSNNTEVPLDAAAMIAVGLAVTAHVSACQAHKNTLRDLIDAAADLTELEAIDLEGGWPTARS